MKINWLLVLAFMIWLFGAYLSTQTQLPSESEMIEDLETYRPLIIMGMGSFLMLLALYKEQADKYRELYVKEQARAERFRRAAEKCWEELEKEGRV